MLSIERLSAGYGEARVLRDVDLHVERGEVVTLCGRNGAGKTTLLRCVMGLHGGQSGRVTLAGVDLARVLLLRRRRRAGHAVVAPLGLPLLARALDVRLELVAALLELVGLVLALVGLLLVRVFAHVVTGLPVSVFL